MGATTICGSRAGLASLSIAMLAGAGCDRSKEAPAHERDRAAITASEAGVEYTLGVFPHLPPNMMSARSGELAAAIGRGIGAAVQPRTAATFETFFERLQESKYDFALVQPFDYVRLAPRLYQPVARMDAPLSALFVVGPTSKVSDLASLRGARIAMPPEDAAVSYLARALLRREGIAAGRDVTIQYTRNHASCLQEVMSGAAVACVTNRLPLTEIGRDMKVEFRVIAETEAIPHIVFVVKESLPDAVKQRARTALLALGDTDAGRSTLKRAGLERFLPATDADYEPVRVVLRESQKVD